MKYVTNYYQQLNAYYEQELINAVHDNFFWSNESKKVTSSKLTFMRDTFSAKRAYG